MRRLAILLLFSVIMFTLALLLYLSKHRAIPLENLVSTAAIENYEALANRELRVFRVAVCPEENTKAVRLTGSSPDSVVTVITRLDGSLFFDFTPEYVHYAHYEPVDTQLALIVMERLWYRLNDEYIEDNPNFWGIYAQEASSALAALYYGESKTCSLEYGR